MAQTESSLWLFFLFYIICGVSCNCDSEIYCRGPILEKIQMSGLFVDSKQFVDMPTSKSKAVVRKNSIITAVFLYYSLRF